MKKSILQITGIAGMFAIVAVLGVFASNMESTQVMGNASLADLDLQDQMDKVDYAIIGVVKEAGKPYPVENEHDIERYFGDIIITVEEDLYGTVSEREITVRTHANARQAPTFEEGERVLLFLIAGEPKSVEGEGVFVVSGMFQGKYSITDDIVQDPKNPELTYSLTDLRTQVISNRG